MNIKKRKKASRMHGKKMGSHGHGARKKWKGSGHRGGKGMAGTGKRGDQKKTLMTKLYGNKYFGKQGITSKGTKRDKRDRINLMTIEENLGEYAKKVGDKWEINLKEYKILGKGEIKSKLVIHAKEASSSALEKVKKAGGEIILKTSPKHIPSKKTSNSAIEKVKKAGGEIILPNHKKKVKTEEEAEEK